MLEDFSTIYNLNRDAIFRYCLWKCRDREVGQDLMQETFLRYWIICLDRLEEIIFSRAYLYRIAHNLIVDHMRRRKEASLDQLLEIGFEPSIDLWHQTYSHLDAEKPLMELGKMPNPYRRVLHYRFIMGLAPSEIATITGETSNTVSVRIFRGLRHLRSVLKNAPQVTHEALLHRGTRARFKVLKNRN